MRFSHKILGKHRYLTPTLFPSRHTPGPPDAPEPLRKALQITSPGSWLVFPSQVAFLYWWSLYLVPKVLSIVFSSIKSPWCWQLPARSGPRCQPNYFTFQPAGVRSPIRSPSNRSESESYVFIEQGRWLNINHYGYSSEFPLHPLSCTTWTSWDP